MSYQQEPIRCHINRSLSNVILIGAYNMLCKQEPITYHTNMRLTYVILKGAYHIISIGVYHMSYQQETIICHINRSTSLSYAITIGDYHMLYQQEPIIYHTNRIYHLSYQQPCTGAYHLSYTYLFFFDQVNILYRHSTKIHYVLKWLVPLLNSSIQVMSMVMFSSLYHHSVE